MHMAGQSRTKLGGEGSKQRAPIAAGERHEERSRPNTGKAGTPGATGSHYLEKRLAVHMLRPAAMTAALPA